MGRILIAILLTLLLSTRAMAWSGIGMAIGKGGGETDRYRVCFTVDWEKEWVGLQGWHITGYWEVGMDDWRGKDNSLLAVSLIPVLRLQKNGNASQCKEGARSGAPCIFIDVAVGLYLLSESNLGEKDFSTAFQFGSHAGIGIMLGRFEVGYRFEHISNGGIKEPNPGINFYLLRVVYRF